MGLKNHEKIAANNRKLEIHTHVQIEMSLLYSLFIFTNRMDISVYSSFEWLIESSLYKSVALDEYTSVVISIID